MSSQSAFFAAVTTTVKRVVERPCRLTGYFVYNPNSSAAYLQIFDSTGTVTLGTTLPNPSLGIPATAAANAPIDRYCTNGLQVACTTTATGSTAPSTGLDITLYFE